MHSDLDAYTWSALLSTRDGAPITEFPQNSKTYIDGYPLSNLPEDTILTITLTGTKPQKIGKKNICAETRRNQQQWKCHFQLRIARATDRRSRWI